MKRNIALLYVLSGIVILNVLAIIFLSNSITDDSSIAPTERQQEIPPERQVLKSKLLVRTFVMSDKNACPECYDINEYLPHLEEVVNMSVTRTSPGTLDLPYYPAIAFNATIEEYPANVWEDWAPENIITIPSGPLAGKWYVLYTLNPPYYDVQEDRVRGLVTITYLTLDSCEECYSVDYLKTLLDEQGVVIKESFTHDALSPAGQSVVGKYGITRVPTIVMDEEAGVYPGIAGSWASIGTYEDGHFILRELERLQVPHYDLSTRKVMKP